MLDTRPHAVRSPLTFAGSGDSAARLWKLQGEFAEVLKTAQVYVRHQGKEHFITDDPTDTLNYPTDSPRANEPRYVWKDRGDGVLYGYLKSNSLDV
jgi:hypothetical protein